MSVVISLQTFLQPHPHTYTWNYTQNSFSGWQTVQNAKAPFPGGTLGAAWVITPTNQGTVCSLFSISCSILNCIISAVEERKGECDSAEAGPWRG